MANILTLETNKYAIKLENFEGPLDLLCHLIDINQVNIYEINLNDITDQYISFIKEMEKLNLEIASEFLVMASTLLYLKSRSLLPKQDDDTEEITEEELIKRIVDYKKYKEVSKKLKECYEKAGCRYFKYQEEYTLPNRTLEEEYQNGIIPKIYENIVLISKEKINHDAQNIEKIAITETYTIASKVKEMISILIKNKRFVFNRIFSTKKRNKQEIVTAFSGLLELSRRNEVLTNQDETFGDITVEKNKKTA